MRLNRLVVAATAVAASSFLIACGSDSNDNSPGNSTITTPSLGSTSITTPVGSIGTSTGSTLGGSTGSSTMDTSSAMTTTP